MVHDAADVPAGPASLDSVRVAFDEERLISDAGLLVTATLAERLGIEELVNESVWLDPRLPGASLPGRKVLSLVHGMLAGADRIDQMNVLRAGSTGLILGHRVMAPSTLGTFLRAFTFGHVRQLDRVLVHGMLAGADRIDQMNVLRAGSTGLILGHRVMAPSTLGTFLRAFTFGHVRQLDRVLDVALARAWGATGGPGDGPLVIDVDSFIGEVCSDRKQGASYGYTRKLGYHPIVAVRADTGEVLHIRNRQGKANTQRGLRRFVEELLARVRRAGHSGPIIIRADTGFENRKLMNQLARHGVEFSIGIKQSHAIRALIAEIPEADWVTIVDYPETGEAQIAETTLGDWRLIVRRTRLVGAQAELFPDWRHPAFATNRTIPLLVADVDHRDHAQIELAIRDLKDQALCHFPSGQMHANSAWTVIAALAHNLGRWTTLIGVPTRPVQTARIRRRQLLQIAARLTRTSRRWTLRLPARWPWQTDFTTVLDTIRALPTRT